MGKSPDNLLCDNFRAHGFILATPPPAARHPPAPLPPSIARRPPLAIRNGKQRERETSFWCVIVPKSTQRQKMETRNNINNDNDLSIIAHYRVKPQLDSTPAASTILL
jgi:hypothetical protein